MVEKYKLNTGTLPDKPAAVSSLGRLLIRVAEELGDITYEWKGRHLVRKPSGEGGLAGYLRSMDIICRGRISCLGPQGVSSCFNERGYQRWSTKYSRMSTLG